MRAILQLGILALWLSVCGAAETLDRIVVVIDNQPILQSEWDDTVAFEAMMQGAPLSSVSNESRRKTLDRMVDQQLLLAQMQAEVSGTAEEAQRALADLRSSLKLQNADEWRRYLGTYGLSEEDCLHQLSLRLEVLRFADFRLRASVKVDRSEVEAYYRDRLVPEVEKRGAKPDPLDTVAPKIERLLTEQKISDMLSSWLHNLRDQGNIRYMIEVPQSAPASSRPAAAATIGKAK